MLATLFSRGSLWKLAPLSSSACALMSRAFATVEKQPPPSTPFTIKEPEMAQQLRMKTEAEVGELMKQALDRKLHAAPSSSPLHSKDAPGAAATEEGPAPTGSVNQFEGPTNPKTGEVGGPKGLEPTRFSDWERGGRCSDF